MERKRSLRLAALAAALGVLLTAAGSASGLSGAPDDGMSPEARTYLTTALDLMEQHSVLRHQVDWAQLRRRALDQAHGARTAADTYGVIASALNSVHDGHSFFAAPKTAAAVFGAVELDPQGLQGTSLDGDGIGYLVLRAVEGSAATLDGYVRRGRQAVATADRAGACGWIVDLRGDSGGAVRPMLAVLGPILGDGPAGGMVDADGRRAAWSVEHGNGYEDGRPIGWADSRPIARSVPPVAVLTGQHTASSGEAVVVAFHGRPGTRFFGEPTYGVPTGNNPFRLSDGAVLNLTTADDVDRTGRTYDAPIPPDEEVANDPAAAVGSDRDRVLAAARAWLHRQPGCQGSQGSQAG
ncbi:S41 family peptidase [Kitasatospora cathayae]|uniref:S41 family peptidase n=1 Tax=Kitasatospora cathayae TaxID=3004092 RepID=A0ABY7PYB6_9ACTN|nr:S41 family peptidase [Kitasatospora sp. HUAS 3-15]WBP85364.1 S41 family peptidase [Kitasatospora sp. HUAS 3-15]